MTTLVRASALLLFVTFFIVGNPIPVNATGTAITKPPNNLSLIAYYSFNEGTSTIATDFSGGLNAGTLSGFASPPTAASGWNTVGKRGGGLQFDGTNDYVLANDINSLDGASRLTVSFWAKADVLNDFTQFVLKLGGSPTTGWAISSGGSSFCGGSNDIAFNGRAGTDPCCYTTGNVHATGVWEHWVITFDGSRSAGDRPRFFKNGVQQASTCDDVESTATLTPSTWPLTVGQTSDNGLDGDAYFDGIMDEVRVYARALSNAEAIALYAGSGSAAVRANASSKTLTNGTTLGAANGLVGLWTFDGADTKWSSAVTGATLDGSGNGNTGTLTSMSRAFSQGIGKLGQALNFDGVNDTVKATDINSTDGATQLTVAAWIKPDTLADWTPIVSKCDCDTGTANWELAIAAAGMGGNDDLTFWPDGSAGGYTVSDVLETGVWQHVAVVYDGTQADSDDRILIYYNGEAMSDASTGTISTQTATNSVVVGIGQHGGTTPDPYFDGAIDEVRVYNRALTPAEMRQLYQLGALKIDP